MPGGDRRRSSVESSSARDLMEQKVEADVAEMKKILQRTKAEVDRSKKIADKIERRTKLQDPDKKN